MTESTTDSMTKSISESAMPEITSAPIPYYNLVLGKEYMIKKDNILYKGMYYMHYTYTHDEKDPITFINVTPNPNKIKFFEFDQSDKFYE